MRSRTRWRRHGRRPTEIAGTLLGADQVVYAGAGSSYYLAQAAAWAHREMLGRAAVAAPLSELLLRPAGVISAGPTATRPIVVISRSGSTSEAVAAATWGVGAGHPVIGVTCRPIRRWRPSRVSVSYRRRAMRRRSS